MKHKAASHNGNTYETDFSAKVIFYREEKGLSFGQIAEVLDRPKPTVYDAYQTAVRQRQTVKQTAANGTEKAESKPSENADTDAKNPVSSRLQVVSFGKEFAQTFHPADLIFYACVCIGCLGVSNALPGVGIAVAAVWFFTAAMLLHRLKMYRRWYDVVFGIVVEVLAGGTAHYSWANAALWRNIKELPFEVYVEKYRNGAGELVAFYAGKDVEMPGKIAVCIAACLVVFAGYAAFVSVLANKEKG